MHQQHHHPIPWMTLPESLIATRNQAFDLFQRVQAEAFICPGRTEQDVNDAIFELAQEHYGVQKHWHKKIVRAGENTIHPYRENPPNRVIQEDDIVFFDFGPVFDGWEADYGDTVVLGNDPEKHRIKNDLYPIFKAGQQFCMENPQCTGGELFSFVVSLCRDKGWQFGNRHCGHTLGFFPHERIQNDKIKDYLCEENQTSLGSLNDDGDPRHWILEIHLIHPSGAYGAFFEDLVVANL